MAKLRKKTSEISEKFLSNPRKSRPIPNFFSPGIYLAATQDPCWFRKISQEEISRVSVTKILNRPPRNFRRKIWHSANIHQSQKSSCLTQEKLKKGPRRFRNIWFPSKYLPWDRKNLAESRKISPDIEKVWVNTENSRRSWKILTKLCTSQLRIISKFLQGQEESRGGHQNSGNFQLHPQQFDQILKHLATVR